MEEVKIYRIAEKETIDETMPSRYYFKSQNGEMVQAIKIESCMTYCTESKLGYIVKDVDGYTYLTSELYKKISYREYNGDKDKDILLLKHKIGELVRQKSSVEYFKITNIDIYDKVINVGLVAQATAYNKTYSIGEMFAYFENIDGTPFGAIED